MASVTASRLLQIPRRFYSWYDRQYEKFPLFASGATMGIKAGACDTLAQKWAEPDSKLDFQRIATFTFFCVGYVGSFQHILFSRIYPRIFPGEGLGVAVKKALFDNFVHSPLLYLPAYYSFRSVAVDGDSVSKGLSEYSAEGWTVLNACWGVWIPAQFINFYVVPKNFRILFIACVGSFWEMILSSLSPMKASFERALQGNEPAGEVAHDGVNAGEIMKTNKELCGEAPTAAAAAPANAPISANSTDSTASTSWSSSNSRRVSPAAVTPPPDPPSSSSSTSNTTTTGAKPTGQSNADGEESVSAASLNTLPLSPIRTRRTGMHQKELQEKEHGAAHSSSGSDQNQNPGASRKSSS